MSEPLEQYELDKDSSLSISISMFVDTAWHFSGPRCGLTLWVYLSLASQSLYF